MISNKSLGVIALGTAFFGSLTLLNIAGRIKKKILEEPYFVASWECLKNHSGAKSILGEPINMKSIDLGDPLNKVDGLSAEFNVPVVGSKCKGVMYLWANRGAYSDNWNVERVELEVNGDKTKRLRIFNRGS